MKRILDFFSSIKLAMFLFILIALGSSLGTFIQQNVAGSKAVLWLSEKFDMSHEAMYHVLIRTGLADVYSSWWFILLLVLFGLNLAVCTFYRLPHVYKQLKTPVSINKNIFESENSVHFQADSDAPDRAEEFLKGYKMTEEQDGDTLYIAAERGRFSRAGVYVTHLGVMVILIAALFGITAGYKGNLAVVEGEKDNVIVMKDKKEKKLPFYIRLENFDVEFYKDSVKPKLYRSDIIIIDGDKKIPKVVMVNMPVKYKGFMIYQTNYGFYPNDDVLFRMKAGKGGLSDIPVKFNMKFSIPDTGLTAMVVDFAPSLGQDDQGRLVNFNSMMMNPAVLLEVFDENGVSLGTKWIFQKFPESGDMADFKIVFADVSGAQYSVFSVTRDPSNALVYLGFIILSMGVVIAFYFRHDRIWVRIKEDETGAAVSAYADRSKFRSQTTDDLERFKQFIIK